MHEPGSSDRGPETAHRDTQRLTRREVVRRVSALLGGTALVGQSALLAGCAASDVRSTSADVPAARAAVRPLTREQLFAAEDLALLDEIAETILPATSTPGAKAAGVGPFIATMVADCYDGRDQALFRDGLRAIERECEAMHGVSFMTAQPTQRTALLESFDREQFGRGRRQARRSAVDPLPHCFRMMKELTLLGYFTSEVGYTQAMRYVETPGRFDPCVPWTPGEKAWASHA